MRVLITGGSGFIGTHVAHALLKNGHDVCIYDLQPTSLSEVKYIQGDILDEQRLLSALLNRDAVVHLAAQVSVPESLRSPKKTHEINVIGTQNVIDCCEKTNIQRIVIASSAAVYGDLESVPLSEESVGTLLSPYAHSKAENEQQILKANERGFEAVALRFFNVYGPNQNPTGAYSAVIPSILKCLTEGQQPVVYGDGMQTRDFIHAHDVSACILKLLSTQWNEISSHVYNVATSQQISILDLLSSLNAACIEYGILEQSSVPVFKPAREGDIRHSVADISRIKHELGWTPTIDFDDGIRELVKLWRRE